MNTLEIWATVLLSLIAVPIAIGGRCAWLADNRYRP